MILLIINSRHCCHNQHTIFHNNHQHFIESKLNKCMYTHTEYVKYSESFVAHSKHYISALSFYTPKSSFHLIMYLIIFRGDSINISRAHFKYCILVQTMEVTYLTIFLWMDF